VRHKLEHLSFSYYHCCEKVKSHIRFYVKINFHVTV
jgi:hypothetical protein